MCEGSKYCDLNGITRFSEVTSDVFLNFSIWMKESLSIASQTACRSSHIIEDIIKTGQVMGWDVPQTNIFALASTKTFWNINKDDIQKNKTKPIPEPVFNKILYYVTQKETDIITKAGIIIQSQTGLRINEVLSIKAGCIHTSVFDGVTCYYMEVMLSKTLKGDPIPHKVFINDLVRAAIDELSKAKAPLRTESGLQELFLTKSKGTIQVMKVGTWQANRIPGFIKKWDIRDSDGEFYKLHSHQFRATFVRELIKQSIPIAYIMKQYSHVSVEMTAHYLTLKEDEVKEIYTDMVMRPDSKIAGIRAEELRGKLDTLFHGKTEAEIDDAISNLAKTMSFNPLPTGVCLYDFRRGNCTDGDGCFFYNCPNYITESRFYPVLKGELDLLESEMTRLKELGQERAWQVQYVKWKALEPLVGSLEEQINGK